MVGTDVLLRGSAALVGVTFAVLLVPAIRRSRAALWLAVFLALVAVNQLAETIRLLSPSSQALSWFRLASVVASLDPLALYLFAAHARPGSMRTPARIAMVAIPAFALAIWATTLAGIPFVSNGPPADAATFLFALALSTFTTVVYVALLAWAIDGLLREPGRAAWSPLVFAIAVMAVPRIAYLTADAYDVALRGPVPEWVYVMVQLGGSALLSAALAGALVAYAFPRADARQRAVVGWALALGVAITIGVKAQDVSTGLSVFFGAPRTSGALIIGQTGTASRFLLFGALASTALLRYDALGLSLAARRRSARVLVALVFIIAGAALIPLAEVALVGRTTSLTTLDLGLLAAVIVLSQGFQRVVDRVASRVYGVPMPGDATASREAYRRAAASAIAEGRDPGQDPELAHLREELGLDEATASILARVADESEGGPLREGLHVGGRYRVLRFLGAGGSGRAFLAEDTRLQRRVVLKEARDLGEGDAALAEARIAGGLANPHVVAVYDAFRRRGSWVLVLENAEGGSLESLLHQAPLPPARAQALLQDVVAGVAAVHAKGIVHGDLKPHNVLLSAEGRARIADFGLARLARGRTAPLEGPAMGTPDFLAPEQRRGAPVTARTDVYALGLLAKRLFPEGVPPALAPVVERALQEDPMARFADAGDMLRSLAPIQ